MHVSWQGCFRYLSCFICSPLWACGFLSPAPGTSADTHAIKHETELLTHSDRHDHKRLRLRGVVQQSGHYFWDLLFISSYTLQTSGGLTLLVFADGAVPSQGQALEVVGVFRQYYQGSYGSWLGLVEKERRYMGEEILAGGE